MTNKLLWDSLGCLTFRLQLMQHTTIATKLLKDLSETPFLKRDFKNMVAKRNKELDLSSLVLFETDRRLSEKMMLPKIR